MDPLTALSVAGTVVQFVDFAWELFTDGRELYKSSTGALAVNDEMELITTTFQAVVTKLHITDNGVSLGVKDERQLRIEKIRAQAEQIAGELIKLLNKLKIKSKNDKHRAWQSVKQVIKSAASKEEIADLEKRLERFRVTVQTEFILDIRWALP